MELNGGSVVAMVGKDCVAIASDLRLGQQSVSLAQGFEKVRLERAQRAREGSGELMLMPLRLLCAYFLFSSASFRAVPLVRTSTTQTFTLGRLLLPTSLAHPPRLSRSARPLALGSLGSLRSLRPPRPQVFPVNDRLYIGLSGLATDTYTLRESLRFRVNMYRMKEEREITPETFTHLVSSTLYEKR